MNGWSDDFYRRLYGSLEAPMDWSEFLPKLGPRDTFRTTWMTPAERDEYRAEGEQIRVSARRQKIIAAVIRRREGRVLTDYAYPRPRQEQVSGGSHCPPPDAMEGSL